MIASDCDTPALLLDMDAAERNIEKMAAYFRGKKAALRPHAKVHKSPFLAQKLIDAGAKGITVAKVSEAEVMARGGIHDILIANEVVGEYKVKRLARVAKLCELAVIVDTVHNARQISDLAAQEGSRVRVLVDVNLSGSEKGVLDRTGVVPADALGLAREVSKLRNLEFGGLMGYEGSLSAFPDAASKVAACRKALGVLTETARTITDAGLEVRTVSSSGTMSYRTAAEFPGVTEVQAGGYLFMDIGYRNAGVDFETSLTLLTTVVSKPRPNKLIVDAGYKAISAESGLPGVKDRPDLEVTSLNAEHGHLAIKSGSTGPSTSVEDKLELLPTHADTTTCLHDEYVLLRGGEVDSWLPIAGRGKLQ
ncbi:MAG: DSD1 family PLP-dependent enzyme [Nitrososphaerales archaeon]